MGSASNGGIAAKQVERFAVKHSFTANRRAKPDRTYFSHKLAGFNHEREQ
jgi:hypothetical protein